MYLLELRAQFHNNLIQLNFNPKYFQSSLLEMLKDEYIVYQCIRLISIVFIRKTQRLISNLVSNYIGFMKLGPGRIRSFSFCDAR